MKIRFARLSRTRQRTARSTKVQLPVEFREVILLREYEELSYEEIAAMLQCPVGTVMSRLARARSKLRELVGARAMPPSATKGADNVRDTQREIGRSG
jgi:DNA-directed RNA polymerase specialized sigma24 family protein